ncbi:MAG: DUF1515 family protein [Cyanophyceae cyanobacterium]
MTAHAGNNGWQQAILSNTKALGGLEVKVDRLEVKVDRIESDIATLKTDVATLKTDIGEIKPVIKWIKTGIGILGAIALGVAANLVFSIYQSSLP